MLQSFQLLQKSEEVWKIRNFGKRRAVGIAYIKKLRDGRIPSY
jgi:hypothetical protein